jgi:large subunit ribosomal protein L17
LLKGLVRSLLIFQKIKTTETRAKDIKIIAERVITSAKKALVKYDAIAEPTQQDKADLMHARRQVNRYLTDETLTGHVFNVIAPEFKSVAGGYTRITKIGQRRGDAAPIVMLELSTDKELGRPVLPEKIGTKRVEKTW